jgi:hypothetical protein
MLSAHSRKWRTSDKSLTQSFEVLRSSRWRFSSWMFSFCDKCCFSEVSHPQQYSIATRDTVIPMNIEVPTKYPLSHNDRIIVLEIRLHSESLILYRPVLHGNWNALSLARWVLKDKFPTPMIPLTAVLPNRQVFLPDPVYWGQVPLRDVELANERRRKRRRLYTNLCSLVWKLSSCCHKSSQEHVHQKHKSLNNNPSASTNTTSQ